ncbi:MAG: oligosaccharide flippase family protein [Salibacteraceae bacterium]
MATGLKKLAGQTAVYGLSSIVGRFLNYLLTPLYTSKLVFSPEQYGIITEMYAYVAFLVVILTYGMETAFFRFYSSAGKEKPVVYSTAITSLLTSSTLFVAITSLYAQSIASFLGYPNHQEFIIWFGIIVAVDALVAIPMAKLRAENKAIRFAAINLSFVTINIGLNLFFLAYCLPMHKSGVSNWVIDTFYNPEIQVGYVFIANLVASLGRLLLVSPQIIKATWRFSGEIWRKMVRYGFPLLIAGLAGIVNETLDRALLKWLLWDRLGEVETMTQLGIYGACYKLSIIITLCVQAYRYAAEPFFFDQQRTAGATQTYARMMHVFIGLAMFVFLVVTLFLDIFKYFIPNDAYWVGLDIVPILLLANVFLGIYYNLSVWYKLTDKTVFGSYLSIMGAIITVVLNLWLVPVMGFRGSAWATLCCYGTMAIASAYLGRKHYRVPYRFGRMVLYMATGIALYFLNLLLIQLNTAPALLWVCRMAMLAVFALFVVYQEKLFIYHGSNTNRQ